MGRSVGLLGGWAALSIVLVFYVLSYLDRTLLSLMVEPIQASLGVSDVQIGVLQGLSFALFYAVVGLPVGWAVDRYSKRWIIFIGVCIWSVCTALCGLTRNFAGLALARAGVGAGEATLAPAAFALMPQWFPKERLGTAMGVYYLGSNFGSSLALLIGGLAMAFAEKTGGLAAPGFGSLEPWQTVFLMLGAPGVALAFLIFLVRERIAPPTEVQRSAAMATWSELFAFARGRRTLVFCHLLAFPLLALLIIGLHAWAPAYMGRRFGWGPAQVGPWLAAAGLLGGAFNVGLGWAADALFRRGVSDSFYRVQIWSTVLGAPFVIGAFLVSEPVLFVALYAIGTGSLSFGGPAVASLQLIAPDHVRGKLSAVYLLLIAAVGTGLGPLIPALITDHVFEDRTMLGYSLIATFSTIAPIACILLLVGLKHLRRELGNEG